MHFLIFFLLSLFAVPALCQGQFFDNSSALTAFLGDGDTVVNQNDILKNSSCAAMTVLFARGTAEPGNVGFLTGPAFFAAVAAYMNGTAKLAVQGVDYPADTAGFFAGGSPAGAVAMAALVNRTLATCPSTLLTLSGYSQGAQVVHNTLPMLPTSTTDKISSIVLFGDPKNGTAIANVDMAKVQTFCRKGDDICAGGDEIGIQHLSYSLDAGPAADWVVNGMGMAVLGISSARVKTGANGGIGG